MLSKHIRDRYPHQGRGPESKLHGLSVVGMARDLEIDPSYVRMLLKGTRRPSLGMARKIGRKWGLEVEGVLRELEKSAKGYWKRTGNRER